MVNFAKDSIKPSFGKKKGASNKNSSASQDLSAAEYFASNKKDKPSNSSTTSDVAENEGAADSLYTGSGRSQFGGKKGEGKGKGFFKKHGAIAFIVATILGGGAMMFGSTSLLGGHLSSLMTEATDTQYITYSMRNKRLFSYMLDGGDQIKTTWTGAKKYQSFTPLLKNRLNKAGIQVGRVDPDTGEFIEEGAISLGARKNRVLKFNDEIIEAKDFSVKYATDPEFRETYYKAKRGRIAGFFDDMSEKVFKKLGLSRNAFKDFEATDDADTDAANYKETSSKQFGEGDTDISTRNKEYVDEDGDGNIDTDENGNPKTVKSDSDTSSKKVGAGVDANAEAKARAYIDGISKATQVANIGCAILKVGNAIAVAVAANEIYQAITYYQTNMENVSKSMAGEGDKSAINPFLNFMTTPATTETENISAAKGKINSMTSSEFDGGQEIPSDPIKEKKSPLEAEGMKLMLGANSYNQTSVLNYSLERVKFAFTTTVGSFVACAGIQSAAAVVSIVSTVMTFGISTLVSAGISIGVQVALGVALAWLIPTIAQALFSNPADLVGVQAGEFFAKGAEAANSRLARSASGASPVSKDAALAFEKESKAVLALDAEIDRKNHSPFDISNKNTFLGSIAYSFMSVALTSRSNNSSIISNVSSLAGKTFASLLPSTYADGEGESYQTTFGNCPLLEEIGAVGDIYCNPISVVDVTTVDLEPTDTTYQQKIDASVDRDADGNETIKRDSNLYKYINFCTERNSPYGAVDANILNQLDFLNTGSQVGDAVVNSIPIIGDIADAIQSSETVLNLEWGTGAICVNSSSNSTWNTEFKYYQRYIEDNRILDQMGAFEGSKNPVTAAKEDFEELFPIDNSEAGYISRIAGITKDDAEVILAIANYYDFIANYDATDLYAFGAEETEEEVLEFNAEEGNYVALLNPITFNELRNRSYAV